MDWSNWVIIANIASGFSAAAGLIFVGWQMHQQIRMARFTLLTQLHSEVTSTAFRESLRYVFENYDRLKEQPFEDNLKHVDTVTAVYDLIAVRIKDRAIPKRAALQTEWKILIPLWIRIREFVLEERNRRGVPYKADFEWLVNEAAHYMLQKQEKCPMAKVWEDWVASKYTVSPKKKLPIFLDDT